MTARERAENAAGLAVAELRIAGQDTALAIDALICLVVRHDDTQPDRADFERVAELLERAGYNAALLRVWRSPVK